MYIVSRKKAKKNIVLYTVNLQQKFCTKQCCSLFLFLNTVYILRVIGARCFGGMTAQAIHPLDTPLCLEAPHFPVLLPASASHLRPVNKAAEYDRYQTF